MSTVAPIISNYVLQEHCTVLTYAKAGVEYHRWVLPVDDTLTLNGQESSYLIWAYTTHALYFGPIPRRAP